MPFRRHSGLREWQGEGKLTLLSDQEPPPKTPTLSKDIQVLTKVRLNTFVLITTLFGFYLAAKGMGGMSGKWWLLLHTLIGTAASAFGSAAFN